MGLGSVRGGWVGKVDGLASPYDFTVRVSVVMGRAAGGDGLGRSQRQVDFRQEEDPFKRG